MLFFSSHSRLTYSSKTTYCKISCAYSQNSNYSVAIQAAPMSDAFNNLDFHKHVDMKVKELEKNFAFQTHCTEYIYTLKYN